jgi:hypothetical protein
MTEQEADYKVLSLATEDTFKFALGITMIMNEPMQLAFERGLGRDWFRLIDVSPVSAARGQVCRVFKLTDAGRARLAELKGELL